MISRYEATSRIANADNATSWKGNSGIPPPLLLEEPAVELRVVAPEFELEPEVEADVLEVVMVGTARLNDPVALPRYR